MEREALKRIAEKLRRAGASIPAPQVTGTIEGSVVSGLCVALAIVEGEIEALAQPAQEPVQRNPIPKAQSLNELMNRMNQSLQKADMEADMLTISYQSGYHDGKKAALAGREWNFCERCGKRTADLTVIHTCTPPQEGK